MEHKIILIVLKRVCKLGGNQENVHQISLPRYIGAPSPIYKKKLFPSLYLSRRTRTGNFQKSKLAVIRRKMLTISNDHRSARQSDSDSCPSAQLTGQNRKLMSAAGGGTGKWVHCSELPKRL